jgi:hypothetical protein
MPALEALAATRNVGSRAAAFAGFDVEGPGAAIFEADGVGAFVKLHGIDHVAVEGGAGA